jgi:hypothetical protein
MRERAGRMNALLAREHADVLELLANKGTIKAPAVPPTAQPKDTKKQMR